MAAESNGQGSSAGTFVSELKSQSEQADGMKPIFPGATLGVFGGGQLGRMFVQAAQRLGYRVHVFSSHRNSPAGQVADFEHIGSLNDLRSVASFALSIDAATLEFENVPTDAIAAAEQHTPVRPGSHVLYTTQHRLREKNFLSASGIPVGPYAEVKSLDDLKQAVETIGLPAVLKTSQMGYDGKGQAVLRDNSELEATWQKLGPGECILEAFVPFVREVSMLVARGTDGKSAIYGPIANEHKNHILDVSLLPAPVLHENVVSDAGRIAIEVADALDAVGLICIELFECAEGVLLVNEIAPRPHNSGHLTIEACQTSQFEQQVRAMCGLPLGPTESVSPAAMANLLGDHLLADPQGETNDQSNCPHWDHALEQGAALHLYGKEGVRLGRKMGHLTALADSVESAQAKVLAARDALV